MPYEILENTKVIPAVQSAFQSLLVNLILKFADEIHQEPIPLRCPLAEMYKVFIPVPTMLGIPLLALSFHASQSRTQSQRSPRSAGRRQVKLDSGGMGRGNGILNWRRPADKGDR